MTRHVSISAATTALAHVPDLVRFGSKPWRDLAGNTNELSFRSDAAAAMYAPHRVFLGEESPQLLWDLDRPWSSGDRTDSAGRPGGWLDQQSFYELLGRIDTFDLINWGTDATAPENKHLLLRDGPAVVGSLGPAHEIDEALQPLVLLENLACKATGVQALERLIHGHKVDPGSIDYVINAGEEAVGDRYQRGGGGVAASVAEACGAVNANGSDLKAYCSAPVHALVMAGALVAAGTFDRVVVVAGGSLAKLGMKYKGSFGTGGPVLEDVLAGFAALVEPATDRGPVLRLDAVGNHRVGSGSSQQALLEDVVIGPLTKMGLTFEDVDVFATELHNPEITQPAGGGDVPDRNYRLLAAMAVLHGQLEREGVEAFVRRHGLPGFAPTQGHIASAIPWLVHALPRFSAGDLGRTMLLAKGSMFLGKLTRLWDGVSLTMEV